MMKQIIAEITINQIKNIFIALLLGILFLFINTLKSNAQTKIPTPGPDGKLSDFQVDGDRLKVLTTNRGGKPNKVQIKLRADGDWWKMLRVIDKNGNANYIEQENSRFINKKEVIEIDSGELGTEFKLEFWKAKLFGVHTHMMTEIFRKSDFTGMVVTFIWKEGIEDKNSDRADLFDPIVWNSSVDGKRLTVKSTENGTRGYATIKFQTSIDWWAGIKFHDRRNRARLITKQNGRYSPASKTIRIPLDSLASEVKLEFWTAKLLGVHTVMGSKKFHRERFDGRIVTVTWGNPVLPIYERVSADGKTATIISRSGGTPGYATIVFQTNKNWWTALRFLDRNGKARVISKENNRYNPGTKTIKIPIRNLPSSVKLEFWTAKLFGVHTFMASKSITNDRFDGRIVTVTWNK